MNAYQRAGVLLGLEAGRTRFGERPFVLGIGERSLDYDGMMESLRLESFATRDEAVAYAKVEFSRLAELKASQMGCPSDVIPGGSFFGDAPSNYVFQEFPRGDGFHKESFSIILLGPFDDGAVSAECVACFNKGAYIPIGGIDELRSFFQGLADPR
jgi:hypothetical protein